MISIINYLIKKLKNKKAISISLATSLNVHKQMTRQYLPEPNLSEPNLPEPNDLSSR